MDRSGWRPWSHITPKLDCSHRPWGAAAQPAAFDNEETVVTDALIYADMTASPDGRRVDVRDRLAEIHARHVSEDAILFAAQLSRVPLLVAAIERVQRRMTGLPDLGP